MTVNKNGLTGNQQAAIDDYKRISAEHADMLELLIKLYKFPGDEVLRGVPVKDMIERATGQKIEDVIK